MTLNFDVIDLPRTAYRVLPPKRWQIALTVATIAVSAILWALT